MGANRTPFATGLRMMNLDSKKSDTTVNKAMNDERTNSASRYCHQESISIHVPII